MKGMEPADTTRRAFIFGHTGLIVYLAFLNSFVPLSIDLYLPALPRMVVFFDATEAAVNLTLSLFMLCYALSMLVWGPLSDKLGRKPILYSGLLFYLVGSLVCCRAVSIEMLIIGRMIQAVGCGAIQSVSMAIVKDTFRGKTMENVLVWIQTMTVLCPMVAPLLGAFLLKFMVWRGLFWFLFAGGLAGAVLALGLKETLREPTGTSVLRSFSRIPFVLRDPGVRSLLPLFALTAMPFMGWLSVSAFVYQDVFQVSPEGYGYFFAANACCAMLGPILYIRLFRTFPRNLFLSGAFILYALSGLMIMSTGGSGPYVFTLLFMPVTLMGSAIRPLGTLLVMTQLETDNGTVASLLSCTTLLMGSLSMFFAGVMPDPIFAVGLVCSVIGGMCLSLWQQIRIKGAFRLPDMG